MTKRMREYIEYKLLITENFGFYFSKQVWLDPTNTLKERPLNDFGSFLNLIYN